MIGDDELAVLVRAYTFQLISPDDGSVSAQLSAGTGLLPFMGGLAVPYDGLDMYHRDAATSDSSLRWTHQPGGTAGREGVTLTGPASVGAGDSRPSVTVFRTATPITGVFLQSGKPDGVVIPGDPGATLEMSNDGAGNSVAWVKGATTTLQNNSMPVLDHTGLVPRGTVYGYHIEQGVLGANTNITIAGVILITLPVVGFAIAGYIEIDALITAQTLIVADQVSLAILLDGVQQILTANFPAGGVDPVGTNRSLSAKIIAAAPPGNHTVSLRCFTTFANNSYFAIAGQTSLSATYHL